MGKLELKMEQTEQVSAEVSVVERVLVVDDSRAQRRILSTFLRRWNYEVLEAGSGDEALALCQTTKIDLIVSDWMMPGMNGLEFCQRFRELSRDHYGYFILLTSKSEKGEVAHGLDIGADDFLTKPVASSELRARIRAGERILQMEHQLTEKNRLVSEAFTEISSLYEALDRDLMEARQLQQSLVRERFRDFGSAKVSLLLKPSGHVGGDLVGFVPISEDQVCLYSIDVSGHGVASAMMTARLASYLSGSSPEQNIALTRDSEGNVQARPPSEVAFRFNQLIMEEMETELYFTLVLGHANLKTGKIVLTQCGHPHPAHQKADGSVEFTGDGGLPIGLIANAEWEDHHVQLEAGDRLLLVSDGITECANTDGELLDEKGLKSLMKRNARLSGNTFFETMLWDLNKYSGDKNFEDDVSAVLFEFDGRN